MTTLAPTTEDQRKRDREALALLLLLGMADVDIAREYWIQHTTGTTRGVLLGDGWAFDDQRQIYLGRNRHKLDGDDMKRMALAFAATPVEGDLRASAVQVAQRHIGTEEWRKLAARTVKNAYVTEAAIAAGGFDKLTPQDLERIVGAPTQPPSLAFALDKLSDFADAIADNAPRADSEDAIVARAALYAAAGNGVYEEQRRENHKKVIDPATLELKYRYERNILGRGVERHCRDAENTLGCPTVTAAGWQKIGVLPPVGTRTCRANCQCTFEFSLIGDALGTN